MRLVGYYDAERLARRLAHKLIDEIEPATDSWLFVPLPRGGLIVLGMLAYILDLPSSRIGSLRGADAQCVVLVDDCSLSGARLSEALECLSAERVVFAHLLSSPALRAAIVAQEPRVELCLAAEDLEDRPIATDGRSRHPAAKIHERLPFRRYRLGSAEPFAFSWSEPDQLLWNERRQRLEEDWHWAPPHLCLGARAALKLPLFDEPQGFYVVPQGVMWRVDDDEVVLWASGDDQVYRLRGVAGDMWRAVAASGDIAPALEFIVSRYDVDPSSAEADLRSFVAEMLAKGLLARDGQPQPGGGALPDAG